MHMASTPGQKSSQVEEVHSRLHRWKFILDYWHMLPVLLLSMAIHAISAPIASTTISVDFGEVAQGAELKHFWSSLFAASPTPFPPSVSCR